MPRPVVSEPASGMFRVRNLYLDPKTGKLIVEYEEPRGGEEVAIASMLLDPNATTYANLAELDAAADAKLSGIEAGATGDQTGAEVRDLIVALPDVDREIVITDPQTGEFPVVSIQREGTKLDVHYDDVPTP